jgi:hypothetical protein
MTGHPDGTRWTTHLWHQLGTEFAAVRGAVQHGELNTHHAERWP